MYELTLILSILILGYVVKIVYKEEELLVIPHNDKTHDIIFRCISINRRYTLFCRNRS